MPPATWLVLVVPHHSPEPQTHWIQARDQYLRLGLCGSVEGSGRRKTRRTGLGGRCYLRLFSPLLSTASASKIVADMVWGSTLNGTAANPLLILFCPWTPMCSSGVWVFFHFSKASILPLHPLMVGGSLTCPGYYRRSLWGALPFTFMSLSFQLSLLSQIQRFLSLLYLPWGNWVTESLVSSRNSLFIKRHFLETQNNII